MIYLLSIKRPMNLGNNSTKAHIISPKRDMYAKNSILTHLYFNSLLLFILNSLTNCIVYKKLKNILLPLNSDYNKT